MISDINTIRAKVKLHSNDVIDLAIKLDKLLQDNSCCLETKKGAVYLKHAYLPIDVRLNNIPF